jgi:hypothetical protein
MPGKDPHRPEGKTGDAEHQRRLSDRDQARSHSEKPTTEAPDPSRYPAEEQIGGSRPGVPSRMKGESPEDDR